MGGTRVIQLMHSLSRCCTAISLVTLQTPILQTKQTATGLREIYDFAAQVAAANAAVDAHREEFEDEPGHS